MQSQSLILLVLMFGLISVSNACERRNTPFFLFRGRSTKFECNVLSPRRAYVQSYQSLVVHTNDHSNPIDVYVTSGSECDSTMDELLDKGIDSSKWSKSVFPTVTEHPCNDAKCCIFIQCPSSMWSSCRGTLTYKTQTRQSMTESHLRCNYNDVTVSVPFNETTKLNCSVPDGDEPRTADLTVQKLSKGFGRTRYSPSNTWTSLFHGEKKTFEQQPCAPGTNCALDFTCDAPNATCTFHVDGTIRPYGEILRATIVEEEENDKIFFPWTPTPDSNGHCDLNCQTSIKVIGSFVGMVVLIVTKIALQMIRTMRKPSR